MAFCIRAASACVGHGDYNSAIDWLYLALVDANECMTGRIREMVHQCEEQEARQRRAKRGKGR